MCLKFRCIWCAPTNRRTSPFEINIATQRFSMPFRKVKFVIYTMLVFNYILVKISVTNSKSEITITIRMTYPVYHHSYISITPSTSQLNQLNQRNLQNIGICSLMVYPLWLEYTFRASLERSNFIEMVQEFYRNQLKNTRFRKFSFVPNGTFGVGEMVIIIYR